MNTRRIWAWVLFCSPFAIPLTVMSGWLTQNLILASFFENLKSMSPATALITILLSISIVCLEFKKKTPSRIILILSMLILFIIFSSRIFSFPENIELMIIPSSLLGKIEGVNTGVISSLSFCILLQINAISLVNSFSKIKIMRTIYQISCLLTFFTGFLIFTGYIYENPLLSGFVSFPTGINFLVFGLIFFFSSDRSSKPLKYFFDKSTASRILSNILPLLIIMTLLQGIILKLNITFDFNQNYFTAATLILVIIFAVSSAFSISSEVGRKIDRLMEERENAKNEYMKSEKKYRSLVESLREGIILLDANSKIIYANPCIIKLLGKESDDSITGNEFINFIIDKDDSVSDFRKIIENGMVSICELPIKSLSGSQIYSSITVVPMIDSSEKLTGVLLGIMDITDKRNTEIELKKTIEDKNTLLKELYHRTKNNMQIICSMIRLHTSSVSDNSFAKILKELESRILSMALVHQKLYESNDLSQIELKSYIKDLFRFIESYEINKPKIIIDIQENIMLDVEMAVPIGLIVSELIIDSQKHAFKDTPNPSILFKSSFKKNKLMIEYSDNGCGLSDDFSLDKSGQLGLKMAKNIAENQLKGTFEILSKSGFL
ncbi:MAG: PAS domain S-box protein, partial [Spirochaetes bacterium]|nr:PAS domain S-box protein [Spirochaetota bacterium]